MRRSVMISGINRLINALDSTGLAELLAATARAGGPKKKQAPADTLRRFHEFASTEGGFSEDEKAILAAFEIEPLLDTATWLAFVTDDSNGAALQRSLGYKYRSFRAYAPKFVQMVEGEGQKALAKPARGTEALTLVLPVGKEGMTGPERVIAGLGSIQQLFATCAQLAGQPNAELKIASCDSGGDLTFDLLGPKAVMSPLRELLTSIWDRVVLHRELPTDERHKIVIDTLPVHVVIAKRAEEGSLERETSERMRRQVTAGAQSFMDAGCILDSFEKTEHGGPRVLMSPTKRLIEGPIDNGVPTTKIPTHGGKEPVISADA